MRRDTGKFDGMILLSGIKTTKDTLVLTLNDPLPLYLSLHAHRPSVARASHAAFSTSPLFFTTTPSTSPRSDDDTNHLFPRLI